MSLDEQVRHAVDSVAAQLRDDLDRRLQAVAGELTSAVDVAKRAAVDVAVEETRSRVEREVSERVEREVTKRLTETFESERAAAVAQAALDATAAAEQTVAARLTTAFDSERESAAAAAAAERDAAASAIRRDAAAELVAAVTAAREVAAVAAREAAEAAAREAASEAQVTADAARSAAVEDAIEETRAHEQQEFETRLTASIEDAEARVRAEHHNRNRDSGEQLVTAVRAIDAGSSLSEILGALATGAATQAARTAVFVAEGIWLRSWRLSGFGAADGELIRLTVADGGCITEASRQSRVIRASGSEAPAFARLAADELSVAVPLVIAGSVIGVLYADQASEGASAQPAWPAAIEVLGRHAARALIAITATRLAQASSTRASEPMRAQSFSGQR